MLISKARSQTSNCSNHLGKRADCARIHFGQRRILTFDEPTLILTKCLLHSRCVKSTLASGTTTACYFATIHTESTQVISFDTFASLQTDSIEVFLRNSTFSLCFLLFKWPTPICIYQVLGEVCVALGQRALVGKVCMDRNCPDIYG